MGFLRKALPVLGHAESPSQSDMSLDVLTMTTYRLAP
jgi:hypothetical protein